MIVLGLDPGRLGAAAVLDERGEVLLLKLLKDIPFFPAFLTSLTVLDKDVRAFLEKASARPGQGIQRMFNYGAGWGELVGCIKSAEMSLTLVPPAVWAKKMHAGTRLSKPKNRSFEASALLFPGVDIIPQGCRVPHDGLAEALLIAEYGRRQLTLN